MAHERTYFYVGGKYEDNGSKSGNQIMTGQMYVEKLVPADGSTRPYPFILVHGGAQTGTNWLNTPDNRPGWAALFLSLGYIVYIVDQPARGRSPTRPGDASQLAMSVEHIEQYLTSTAHFRLWPQAKLHTQWPGTGLHGDPTFDAFYASQVPFEPSPPIFEAANVAALSALLARTGPAILVTHSQSGAYSWPVADQNPSLVKAIVAIEPAGPPFVNILAHTGSARPWGLCETPLSYSPPVTDPQAELAAMAVEHVAPTERQGVGSYWLQREPARQLRNLAEMPVLVVTSESGYHAVYDWATVRYLRQAGAKRVEHWELGAMGVRGNGHMMFMERNGRFIGQIVEGWVRRICEMGTGKAR